VFENIPKVERYITAFIVQIQKGLKKWRIGTEQKNIDEKLFPEFFHYCIII